MQITHHKSHVFFWDFNWKEIFEKRNFKNPLMKKNWNSSMEISLLEQQQFLDLMRLNDHLIKIIIWFNACNAYLRLNLTLIRNCCILMLRLEKMPVTLIISLVYANCSFNEILMLPCKIKKSSLFQFTIRSARDRSF